LRLIQSGTAPLHQSTLEGLEALSPARVMDNMGGTETAGTSFLNDLALRRGSIFVHGGYAHDCVAQTVDEAGNVIRDGTIGRVRIHSDRLMLGYFDDPGRSSEALGDGWFYSGDMARWQPDGSLRIAGRAIEMIKSAWGDMVFPSEIEAVLIEDRRVREVAACGYIDADGIERIAAFVLLGTESAEPDRFGEELKSLVRGALGPSKVPSIVVLVADMPRLGRDKVDKQHLVKRYLSRE
jgi:acyl-CoA synthetase (AMP-forming)/AMP-acid ligase II